MNRENHMVRPYADDEAPAQKVERDDPDDYNRSEWIEDRDELKEALTDIARTEADERIRAEATRARRAYLVAYFAAVDHLEGKK